MNTDTARPFKPAKGRPHIAEMLIRNALAPHGDDDLARMLELIDEEAS